MQSFAAPLLFHLITRGVAERNMGFSVPVEEVATELAELWVRAMRP